jgi:hypothetical protein
MQLKGGNSESNTYHSGIGRLRGRRFRGAREGGAGHGAHAPRLWHVAGVNQRFSDTCAYGDLEVQFVFSCYLIKHDNDYLLWDTGTP